MTLAAALLVGLIQNKKTKTSPMTTSAKTKKDRDQEYKKKKKNQSCRDPAFPFPP
jgi:hypothetical protein